MRLLGSHARVRRAISMIYSCPFFLVIALGVPAIAQDRMPEIPADKLTVKAL